MLAHESTRLQLASCFAALVCGEPLGILLRTDTDTPRYLTVCIGM